jgi:hypothetical protein
MGIDWHASPCGVWAPPGKRRSLPEQSGALALGATLLTGRGHRATVVNTTGL